MVTTRAKNRKAYNSTKSKTHSSNLNSSSPKSEPKLNGSEPSLPGLMSEWENLNLADLAKLTAEQVQETAEKLSPSQKQQFFQRMVQATMEEQDQEIPAPPLSWNAPQDQDIPSIASSGGETLTDLNRASTGYTASSVPDEPPDSAQELISPLAGKYRQQQKDIEGLLGLLAFTLAGLAQATNNRAFYEDADTIGKYGEEVAESWARLGRKYPWLYTAIDRVCGAAQVGLLLTSTSKMLEEIGQHHGIKLPSIRLRRRMEQRPVSSLHAV